MSHQRQEPSHSDARANELVTSRTMQPNVELRNGDDPDEEHKSVDQSQEETPSEPQTINRTLVSDLLVHLNDEDISDVILKGTDGRTVVAVRSILAMRSRFFKTLLFGDFS